jgi:hypothetical protein
MRRVCQTAGLLLLLLAAAWGCNDKPDRAYPVQKTPALDRAKAVLQRYADGQPMSSEATSFGDIITEVRAENPGKADILETGWEEIKKAPKSELRERSKELLKKL